MPCRHALPSCPAVMPCRHALPSAPHSSIPPRAAPDLHLAFSPPPCCPRLAQARQSTTVCLCMCTLLSPSSSLSSQWLMERSSPPASRRPSPATITLTPTPTPCPTTSTPTPDHQTAPTQPRAQTTAKAYTRRDLNNAALTATASPTPNPRRARPTRTSTPRSRTRWPQAAMASPKLDDTHRCGITQVSAPTLESHPCAGDLTPHPLPHQANNHRLRPCCTDYGA